MAHGNNDYTYYVRQDQGKSRILATYLRPGERLDVQVVGLALRALVRDLNHNGALIGVLLAAAWLVAQLQCTAATHPSAPQI